ncbi:MAG: diaminopimelate epimerase [bacterium]
MNRLAKIPFVKISATGNDFILFDNREKMFTGAEGDFFRKICQRRSWVGADGVLLIENSQDFDFQMRYFNSDGRESEMCGNGARGAAYFALQQGIVPGPKMSFTVSSNRYEATVQENRVRLKMPPPRDIRKNLGIVEESFLREGGFVNTGVPHFVLFTDDLESLEILTPAQKYRYHPIFQPKGTNVDFVQVVDRSRINVRTYERGVEGETLACGTGCVAAAVVASLRKLTGLPVEVVTRGGVLKVYGDSAEASLFLEGEVRIVYEGRLL